MPTLNEKLLANNRKWVEETLAQDPDFFKNLAEGQAPQLLWVGCSDSRVPANQITGTRPGEVFVHRNIANMVVHSDMNMLSVLDYSVNVLKVRHVIVCGHYGCGGVRAAMGNQQVGLIDNWLRHIKDSYRFHQEELDGIGDEASRFRRFVELNVVEQVYNLAKTSIVQNAWRGGALLAIHGWVYDVADGLLRDLEVSVRDSSQVKSVYRLAPNGE